MAEQQSALDPDLSSAIEQASDIAARCDALSRAIAAHPVKTLAAEVTVRRAVTALGENADVVSPLERLRVISIIAQFSEKSKEFRHLGEAPLKKLLSASPASLQMLDNARVRLLTTNLLCQRRANWLANYLAHEAASPLLPDKLRGVLLLALFRNVQTWSDALRNLVQYVGPIVESTEFTDQQLMDTLCGIVAAFRSAIAKTSLDVGEGFGQAWLDIVELVVGRKIIGGRDDKMRTKLVGEFSVLVDSVTAVRPILLANSLLISALLRIRVLPSKSAWPRSSVKAIGMLMTRLQDGIALSVKHGAKDTEMFSSLEKLAGSREGALKYTRPLAKEIAGLPDDVQTWLIEGNGNESAKSAFTDSDDEALALAFLRAKEYEVERQRSFSSSGNQLSALANSSEPSLNSQKIVAVATTVASEVIAMASRRGFELDGATGDVVTYAPLRHRASGALATSSDKVKILVPGVIRRREDGTFSAIVQAIVASIDR